MSRFRKVPVEIEARRFDGSPESGAALVAWLNDCGAQAEYHPFLADHFRGDPKVYVAHPDPFMRVETLEGTMIASRGDWIIQGVKGEFYPCKPDIFAATYEPVAESLDTQPKPAVGASDGTSNTDGPDLDTQPEKARTPGDCPSGQLQGSLPAAHALGESDATPSVAESLGVAVPPEPPSESIPCGTHIAGRTCVLGYRHDGDHDWWPRGVAVQPETDQGGQR